MSKNNRKATVSPIVASVTAKTVRTYLQDHPHLIEDAAMRKNVYGRGRLSAASIRAYRRATGYKTSVASTDRDHRRVVLVGPRGRRITVSTADLRALDGTAGQRGRISAATKAKALELALKA